MAARAHVTHARLRRFLHHVAQLSCQRQSALALHQHRFGGKHLAAHFCPSQARGQPDFIFLLGQEIAILQNAQVIVDVGVRHFDFDVLPLGHYFARDLAANVRDFAAQVPHPGFMSIVPNDVRDRVVRKFQIRLRKPGSRNLFRNQEALRNLMLFLFRVPRDAQNFHAILQRLRNRVQHVCGADEHHLRKVVFHIQIMIGERVV